MKRANRKTWLQTLLIAVLAVALAPASAQAAFGVSKWEAGTCAVGSCTDAGAASAFYTQAAGHPDFGITDFEFNFSEVGVLKGKQPQGNVKDVRVDLPPGLAVNPEATHEKCSEAALNADNSSCPAESQVGEDEATGTTEAVLGQKLTVTEHFPVYNMVRKPGQPARFGVEINSPTIKLLGLQGHLYLEGAISWHQEAATSENSGVASGDFHELFKIENIPTDPEVVESRLLFWGVPQSHTGVGTPTAFLTLPSTCSSRPVTHLHVDSHESPGQFLAYANATPVLATGCSSLAFGPSLALTPGSSQSDQPDGAGVDLHIPQSTLEPARPGSPDLQSVKVTLPEGMTLDPSAAHGLEACSNAQIGLGSSNPIGCPPASKVASVTINAPGLPAGALAGSLYLGAPEAGHDAESGGEYRVFLVAEAPQYGVGLRLEGRVSANVSSGRLTATFAGAPQVPFEDFRVQFNGGPRAPLANPLTCGAAQPLASITPYTGQAPAAAAATGFVVDANGAGGACPAPLPFALTQAITAPNPAQAGAYSPFTLRLARPGGQQYSSHVRVTLPAGVLGAIPSVALCKEPQAAQGKCAPASKVGTVAVAAGAGSEPFTFDGQVYLTGPYAGAPYGLSIVVPAVAGPYNLGDVITRAAINVGLYDARVTADVALPSAVEGIPLRLAKLSVAISRPKFLFNPTSCGPLRAETLVQSTLGAMQSLASGFQVGGCSKLAFKPSLTASTSAKDAEKGSGASIAVKISQPAHEANIHTVLLELPKILPSRNSTLQKACLAASFEAGEPPGKCTSSSRVGSATVSTPVLPGTLSGPAYLVSHGGEEFPTLDLVLRGDGVEVVIVGHTFISRAGITSSKFESIPDVPISSVAVDLPVGPGSLLAANAPPCAATQLLAPTTIIAQNGAKITKKTRIAVSGCPVRVLGHRVKRGKLALTVQTPAAGRVSVSGRRLTRVSRRFKRAGKFTILIPLKGTAAQAIRHHRRLKLKLHVAFRPSSGRASSASPTLTLR
jgi:hypothetical protein